MYDNDNNKIDPGDDSSIVNQNIQSFNNEQVGENTNETTQMANQNQENIETYQQQNSFDSIQPNISSQSDAGCNDKKIVANVVSTSDWTNRTSFGMKIELPDLEKLIDAALISLECNPNCPEEYGDLLEAIYQHLKYYIDHNFQSFAQYVTMDTGIHDQMIKIHFKLIQVIVLCLKNFHCHFLQLLSLLFSSSNSFSYVRCEIMLEETSFTEEKISEDDRDLLFIKLINYFGQLGGFDKLRDCFLEQKLSAYVIYFYLEPFDKCHQFLSQNTLDTYFVPILHCTYEYFVTLSDEEFKREHKGSDSHNQQLITNIIRFCKNLAIKMSDEDMAKRIEYLKIKLNLRVLQVSSFNEKMNALNELNQTTQSYLNGSASMNDGNQCLISAAEAAQWLINNDVVGIILNDCLHQPQYVEKLNHIFRFLLQQDSLTLSSLNKIWDSQLGKHEIIVKNIHELIAKMALHFSVDQLNHLFISIKSNWFTANNKEREKLLGLVGKLAEDDQEGSMADNVLTLLWNIVSSDDSDLDYDIVDQALKAHLKILNNRESLKLKWLERCIDEINKCDWGNNVVIALQQIWDICMLFPGHHDMSPSSKNDSSMFLGLPTVPKRQRILAELNSKHRLDSMLTKNLSNYMQWMFSQQRLQPVEPTTVRKGRRFSHFDEVHRRLKFFRFFLKEGEVWLLANDANEIWKCLAVDAIFPCDRQLCFEWFYCLMDSPEPDLYPEIHLEFLNSNIIKLNPALVDIHGVECFEKFFKIVNKNAGKLVKKDNQRYLMEDSDLIGLDYLWKLILFSENHAASKAIGLLKELYTNLGNTAVPPVELHRDLINTCFDRLKTNYDTISILDTDESESRTKLTKMVRILSFLHQYITKCDEDFGHERTILPMSKSFRGKQITIEIDANFNRQTERLEIKTHNNETFGSIKRTILNRLKFPDDYDIEFYYFGEKLDVSNPSKVISGISSQRKIDLSANVITCTSITAELFDSPENKEQCEQDLPGVLISKNSRYIEFLFQISDLAMSIGHQEMRFWCCCLLHAIPADNNSVNLMKKICSNPNFDDRQLKEFERMILSSPTKTVYLLGILYSLLLPANYSSLISKDFLQFQVSFILNRFCFRILNFLKMKIFTIQIDNSCQLLAWLIILKICKFTLSVFSCFNVQAIYFNEPKIIEALKLIPNDTILKKIGISVGNEIYSRIKPSELITLCKELDSILDSHLVESVLMITWRTATGNPSLISEADMSIIHDYFLKNTVKYCPTSQQPTKSYFINVFDVCDESIEFSTMMFMLAPEETQVLVDNDKFHNFFKDMLLLCHDQEIRIVFMEQFTLVLTKCVKNHDVVEKILNLLCKFLADSVPKYSGNSSEFFQLFCNLLQYLYEEQKPLPIIRDLLDREIQILHCAKNIFNTVDEAGETLLEGHLKITKQVLLFSDSQFKFELGLYPYRNGENECGCVELFMDRYLFTASKSLCKSPNESAETFQDINPICSSSKTLIAAYDLVVAFCDACAQNLQFVCGKLETYLETFSISAWDFCPDFTMRPPQSFVGLKNARATCYMNSVLQQLFMIPELRNGILSIQVDSPYELEDLSEELFFEPIVHRCEDTKTYNIRILQQVQIIFGHLLLSKFQYFEPKGFWKNFKLFGRPINIREQHDALEFFNTLFDNLDEALKALGQDPIMSNVFGGLFSDQKICKDCPHRYCCEESFTTLNVDIRNHCSLKESLEQYVRGDLLEGENAYYCEKCDRKVNTVKRLCIKKLPKVLVIQLKRFDFDYEKEISIKYSGYFEFPRNLDMEPYTVNGLAKKEGESIEEDISSDSDSYQYELTGIVVHSGQAHGGHYYSFIRHETDDGQKKWYKFDDTDVCQYNLDYDEEMKLQCFGGDDPDSIDSITQQPYRKRFWNAFILFYRKVSVQPNNNSGPVSIPLAIKKSVQHKNTLLMHNKMLFSEEFYHFMRSLLECNIKNLQDNTIDTQVIATETLKIAAKFLFSFCFRSKKSLRSSFCRGSWNELILPYLKLDPQIRTNFIKQHLLSSPRSFREFLIECPAADVRIAFSKLLVFLTRNAFLDNDDSKKYGHEIMKILIELLSEEVPRNIKQSAQYFNFFYLYAMLGSNERLNLLQLNVPLYFMLFATGKGPMIPPKGPFSDIKLYQVVSILIRSCDISSLKFLNEKTGSRDPNPYNEDNFPIENLSKETYEYLFMEKPYLQKIIKDGLSIEENIKLILFCCWEDQKFSLTALNELLTHISNLFSYELDSYFNLLNDILLMDDMWQELRVRIALAGTEHPCFANSNRPFQKGIFGIMTLYTTQIDKKAYHCCQLIATLMKNSDRVVKLFKEDTFLRSGWIKVKKQMINLTSNQPIGFMSSNFHFDSSSISSSEMAMRIQNSLKEVDECIDTDKEPSAFKDNNDNENNKETKEEISESEKNLNRDHHLPMADSSVSDCTVLMHKVMDISQHVNNGDGSVRQEEK